LEEEVTNLNEEANITIDTNSKEDVDDLKEEMRQEVTCVHYLNLKEDAYVTVDADLQKEVAES